MTKRARRSKQGGITDAEWRWLTAAPRHNGFMGFRRPARARLEELWAEHRREILALWREAPPGRLPFGHPVVVELPEHLRDHARPDPRALLPEPSRKSVAAHEAALQAFQASRAAWLEGAADG